MTWTCSECGSQGDRERDVRIVYVSEGLRRSRETKDETQFHDWRKLQHSRAEGSRICKACYNRELRSGWRARRAVLKREMAEEFQERRKVTMGLHEEFQERRKVTMGLHEEFQERRKVTMGLHGVEVGRLRQSIAARDRRIAELEARVLELEHSKAQP